MMHGSTDDLEGLLPVATSGAPTLVDGLHRALRDAITRGALPEGYRLREMPLADHFGCSTTPIREAIFKLAYEGLVRIYPRRGAQVASFTALEVDYLYETRLVLETYAIRKSAERRPSKAELAALRALLRQQRDAVSTSDGALLLNAEFHHEIAALSGNSVIADLAAQSTRKIESVQARASAIVHGGRVKTYEAHVEILGAVGEGNADAAVRLMHEHLLWARAAVMSSLGKTA